MEQDYQEIDLLELLHAALSKWWIIAGFVSGCRHLFRLHYHEYDHTHVRSEVHAFHREGNGQLCGHQLFRSADRRPAGHRLQGTDQDASCDAWRLSRT